MLCKFYHLSYFACDAGNSMAEARAKCMLNVFSHMLPNNANLVAKSCLAWLFVTDAYNPSVLVSDGSGHSLALACVRPPLSSLRVTVGCP